MIGLLPGQFREAAKRAPAGLILRHFVMVDGRLKGSFPRGDWALLMKKFVGHSHQERAEAQFGRGRVRVVPGGITGLVRFLESLVSERV